MGIWKIDAVIYEEMRLPAKSGLDHPIARGKNGSVAKLLNLHRRNLHCDDRRGSNIELQLVLKFPIVDIQSRRATDRWEHTNQASVG